MSTRLGSRILHRLSETFTATHLVLLFGIAVLAPTALYATGAFTNVAITDASSGTTAQVDSSHRLRTYDLSAGYLGNPAYAINIVDNSLTSPNVHTVYTVPAGKALLIRSVQISEYGNTEGTNSYYYLYDNSLVNIYNTENLHAAATTAATFEPGIVVHAGTLNAMYNGASGAGVRAYIQGDLIPATAVPAEPGVVIGRVSRRHPQ